jgi:hypothetical protein
MPSRVRLPFSALSTQFPTAPRVKQCPVRPTAQKHVSSLAQLMAPSTSPAQVHGCFQWQSWCSKPCTTTQQLVATTRLNLCIVSRCRVVASKRTSGPEAQAAWYLLASGQPWWQSNQLMQHLLQRCGACSGHWHSNHQPLLNCQSSEASPAPAVMNTLNHSPSLTSPTAGVGASRNWGALFNPTAGETSSAPAVMNTLDHSPSLTSPTAGVGAGMN